MITINSVNLIGRLTKDVDLRFASGSGTTIAKFTLAVPREFKKDETDFINCVAFGKAAETINQYVTKGRQFAVTGRIQTGSYDAQDGTKRYTTDVIVNGFTFVDSNNGANQNNDNANNSNNVPDDVTPVNDGDMPF